MRASSRWSHAVCVRSGLARGAVPQTSPVSYPPTLSVAASCGERHRALAARFVLAACSNSAFGGPGQSGAWVRASVRAARVVMGARQAVPVQT
jgi:hypothetical protein